METIAYLSGAPKNLYVLDYGLFKVHANGRRIGICGFLLETDHGEHVLIDSGFPEKYAYDIATSTKEDRLDEFGEILSLTPENLPSAQLAKAGIGTDDIDLFITSHTHIDHIGGLADFPNAPMLIAATERRLERPLYWGDIQPMEWPDRTYELVEGDVQIGPGFTVLFAPGHAPGQLAFLIDLPDTGPVLLTSDAISRPAEVDEGFAGTKDAATARASAARLLAIAEQKGAFVIYGHSPEQWPTLRKSPEFYS